MYHNKKKTAKSVAYTNQVPGMFRCVHKRYRGLLYKQFMTTPSLTQRYDFLTQEKQWQEVWAMQKRYSWDPNATREETFVVDTPPPTVSGHLHIGHACSYTQADFIVRFQRMIGKNIFYPMGFDDNGLPTERLVEKQKGVRATTLSREAFVALCQSVVATEEEKFRTLFKAMGLSVDWALEYQTISPLSCKLSQMSFLALLEKGEIYRSEQPILWDPVDQTALAQADVEDKERISYTNEILFQHASTHQPLAIATTRPELLPACVALLYHPADERYQHLANGHAITPLFHKRVPILADELVQPDKGTGLVMCCTFGDQTDVIWWKKHQLPLQVMLNKEGILASAAAGPLQGLKVNEARKKVVELLLEQACLVEQTEIVQTIKCAERSGAPLELLPLPQWFVRTIAHKQALLDKADALHWHPASRKQQLESWIQGIAWDWCISRQRYFGVPFPVWYSKRPGEEGKVLVATLDQLPVNPLTDLPKGYTRAEVEPDCDVMDTWATSSISPQLATHAITPSFAVDYDRHARLFPMDLRTQAHEIIRTWAFYTLLKAHLHEGSLPWKNIMIHGWCLASDKNKMSKSKGNVIVPETLLAQYGADVIRYWSAHARLGADTCYCENVLKNGKRLVTKLWNAGKFIVQHVQNTNDPQLQTQSGEMLHASITHTLDRWLWQKVQETIEQAYTYWQAYGYTEALEVVETFFWSVFCDDYLEISKSRAYNETATDPVGQYSAVATLYHSFYRLLQLFAPILPHVTEALSHGMYPHKPSIHQRGSWPNVPFQAALSEQQLQQVERLRNLLGLVRKAKAEGQYSIKAPIALLTIPGTPLAEDLLQDLKDVTAAAEIVFCPTEPTERAYPGVPIVGKEGNIWVVFA
ncbi:MAG TPA: valine--tRNA ligase [Amoebophilaceae bacterium]|nr:valine--tRNA ligase [Amoebophilaceae bacterium]